jgi:hypothetical protein
VELINYLVIVIETNNMETKDYMLGFLKQEANTTYVEEVLDVKIKDCDDEHGPMGKHYIVTLIIQVPNYTLTSGNQRKSVETKCLVDVKQFNDFVEKHRAIIWL